MGIRSRRSGQAAIEYLMVFGIALILSTPFIVKAQDSIIELRSGANAVDVHNSLNNIESAVETVNAAGSPARRTFAVNIPENINQTGTELNTNSIIYALNTQSGTTTISREFEVDLEGDIPEEPGRQRITVHAKSKGVKIEVLS